MDAKFVFFIVWIRVHRETLASKIYHFPITFPFLLYMSGLTNLFFHPKAQRKYKQ